MRDRLTVVIVTRDRRASLLHTLRRLDDLPDAPAVVVVDDASADGSAAAAARAFPGITVIRRPAPEGPVARNHGVRAAATPYVALNDDDSWWAPGALERACAVLDDHAAVAAVAARILVGEERRVDAICEEMERSPVAGDPALPGVPVLSFLAGAVVLRRSAFCQVGGFEPRLVGGGEEESLACDLAAAGWELRYVPGVVAHHHPAGGDKSADRVLGIRNALWFAWRRRPLGSALRWTAYMLRAAPAGRTWLRGVGGALRGLPWVMRTRRVVPPRVETALRALDAHKMASEARRYG